MATANQPDYVPRPAPSVDQQREPQLASIVAWLEQELRYVAQSSLEETAVELRPINATPPRPREGMIIYADGTNWDPGFGEGPYIYRNGVWVPIFAGAGMPREVLVAARTYYVRTDGSDANTGRVDSAAGAFLTLQRAMNVLAGTIDFGGQDVTVQVRTGTYGVGVNVLPWVGGGTLTFVGDTVTPSNVVIAPSTGGIPTGCCFAVLAGALPGTLAIKGFKLTTTGTATFCIAASSSCVLLPDKLDFGPCVNSHVFMASGAFYTYTTNYTISGGASRHLQCNGGGIIFPTGNAPSTVTISAAVAIGTFAFTQQGGVIQVSNTVYVNPGNVTGQKYSAVANGIVSSAGGGPNFFPGTIAGTTATGGQYL